MPWIKNFDVEQTLDKAMQVFWARGYEATSMQDLVHFMGINRGSIYATYGDKRKLFISALQRYDQDWRQSQLAVLESHPSPRAAISKLFNDWIERILRDPDRCGCFLTNTALEMASHDPEIGALVAKTQRETEDFFARLVKKAQGLGEIPAATSPRQAARTLLAALIGMLVLARSRPERALLRSISHGALSALG